MGKKQKSKKKIKILFIAEGIIAAALVVFVGVWLVKSSDSDRRNEGLSENQTDQKQADASDEVSNVDLEPTAAESLTPAETPAPTEILTPVEVPTATETPIPTETPTPTETEVPTPEIPFNAYETETISWNPGWEYADYSQIHTADVTLYRSLHEGRKIIAVNAGHGTSGGSSVKTLCHPDGTAKVTGGSTSEGATYATAIASGTTMLDGTAEAAVTLKLALIVKERLLNAGYSVLMIRENEDTQLDNIARTVFANQNADCHIALHYDSTDYDKGFYYISVPDVTSYKSMEPVASHWQSHDALGEHLLEGMRGAGVKIFSEGSLPTDLTQTSYSTVPSVDVEVGDRGSDYSEETLNKIADGIVEGVRLYFGE